MPNLQGASPVGREGGVVHMQHGRTIEDGSN